ncbi:HMA2 domain-containing protein [uncultured Nitrospira sp.]|uniref:HMA2 domain-containing protein n=1 Tax=uncultured Nitrospira sp. TaxID=157176 RepID=UPI0031404DA4
MKQESDTQILHALPGRVRLKLHRLKNNIVYAADIQRDLLEFSGIKRVAANPQTGSLLIEYDQNIVEVLGLHPSVSSCLGLPLSNLKTPSAKIPAPEKGRTQSSKTTRTDKAKIPKKAPPKKPSKKTRAKS